MKRVLVPEILDHLPHDDPAARRSRRDLRRINALMGNFRWLRRTLRPLPRDTPLTEVGSGDGTLMRCLRADGWTTLNAIDLAPRPPDLPADITWQQADLFLALEEKTDGILVANLFWHHFTDAQLGQIGRMAARFRHVVLSEPHRSAWAMALGVPLVPFVNGVTRHDMFASIRAGFRRSEIPHLWKLRDHGFQIRESVSPLGACRLHAWRTA